MEPTHLPVIDWELSVKLAGNRHDLAEEMLKLFLKTLPDEIDAILQLYKEENNAELLRKGGRYADLWRRQMGSAVPGPTLAPPRTVAGPAGGLAPAGEPS